jgi:hypothetical protein
MLTHIIELLLRLTFDRANQEELPMQRSRKLPTLVPIAVFLTALIFGLTPSLAQNRGGGAGGGGYGTGAPLGDGGYRYGGGGYHGTTGLGAGGGSQSLRTIFRDLEPGPGDQLRERRGDQEDFLQRRARDRLPR